MLSSGCGSSWSLGLVSAHPGMLRQSLDSIIFQTQTAAQRSIANTQNSIFYINHYRYIYIYDYDFSAGRRHQCSLALSFIAFF